MRNPTGLPWSHFLLLVASALAAVANGCGREKLGAPTDGAGGAAGSEPPHPVATGGTPALPVVTGNGRRLRRLSNREYNNVVRDLLGDTTQPGGAFIVDSFQNGYDNGAVGLVVQTDQVESFQEAAESLAATAVTRQLPRLLDGCHPPDVGEAKCAEVFLDTFPTRAFRRPPTDTERTRLRSLFEQAVAVDGDPAPGGGGAFVRGVRTVVEAILQSPQFLYREELGAPGTVAGNTAQVRLTSWEIASALSFLLTGTMPDAPLLAAAAEGRLNDPGDFRREALRLLATADARESLRTFLHQWLATDRLTETTKDPSIYPLFSITAASAMERELNQLFDAVLWTGSGSLRELFTTTDAFVDPTLAPLYGLSATGAGWRRVTLDAATRSGVMTRLGFLTVHADQDSSGPIARGVFLLGSLFCAPPLPRPATVPVPRSVVEAVAAGQTTRQRFQQHASDATCAGCHRLIDGVGFGLEEFDGIGVHRETENGSAVDSSGTLYTTGDVDGPFWGASALALRLVGGHSLPDCFVKQLYRYAMGQVETTADAPLLNTLQKGFSVDQPVTALMLALVSDPAFVVRNSVAAAQP